VYYAKVELMMTQMHGREEAARLMTEFLGYAMPGIRSCLPAAEGQDQLVTTTKPSTSGEQESR
jgi:hypothetical protein